MGITNVIKEYSLSNSFGMQVKFVNFGARVSSILLPVNGKLTEMTLGYSDINSYLDDPFYLGASVGRVCNRIAKGQFTLNDVAYQLSQNSGENCLHGGEDGFSSQYWQVEETNITENSIEFSLFSADGEQGFPGNLKTTIKYTLTEQNQLIVQFNATCDQDTLVNLCNHCYFNLGEPSIDELSLKINADRFLPVDETGIPTGDMVLVENTVFDFLSNKPIKESLINNSDSQIVMNKGFDHCYVLNQASSTQACAELTGNNLGVTLKVFSDQAGLQLYTGQYLTGDYSPSQALCLEAQNLPNAVNEVSFPSVNLLKNTQYNQRLIYDFSG